MNKKTRLIVISLVLVVTIGFVAIMLMDTFGNVYITVDAIDENPDLYIGRTLQVKGNLQPGSLSITSENVTLVIEGENATLTVLLVGELPDMIDGQEIVAMGTLLSEDLLRATQILVKCPSKYETTTEP